MRELGKASSANADATVPLSGHQVCHYKPKNPVQTLPKGVISVIVSLVY